MRFALNMMASSLLLASLLLIGCGKTGQDKKTEEPQGKISIEATKKVQLQKILKTRGATYKTASYSQDRKEIMILGLKENVYTFYKFDADTLDMLDTFTIEVDGTIGFKDIGDTGKYTIIATNDNSADDYEYDSNSKEFHKKDSYQLTDPKTLIQNQFGDTYKVDSFQLTPSKQGALVIVHDTTERILFLYGMENPTNPVREYAIHTTTADGEISDIKLLGKGIISFVVQNKIETGKKHLITYDYFNKKTLSESDIHSVDHDSLKDLIQKRDFADSRLEKLIITPTKLGAIALVKSNALYLYGLEDSANPKQEKRIFATSLQSADKISDIKILKSGILQYTVDGMQTVVKYDYYKHAIVDIHSDKSGKQKIENILKVLLNSKNYFVTFLSLKSSQNLEDNKYLITYDYANPQDSYTRTSVLDISAYKEVLLTHMKYGPGGDLAKDISIDKDKHLIHYAVSMKYHHIPEGKVENDYIMDGDIKYSYNYKTGKKRKTLPVPHNAESLIRQDIQADGLRMSAYQVTQSGLGAIAITSHKGKKTWRIYGIEDPLNPLLEKEFEIKSPFSYNYMRIRKITALDKQRMQLDLMGYYRDGANETATMVYYYMTGKKE